MTLDWVELRKAMYPTRTYEDLRKKWRDSIAYACVRKAYNLSMPEMADYTRRLLGEDSKNRYTEWLAILTVTFERLEKAGVQDVLDLIREVDTLESLEGFIARSGLDAKEVVGCLSYMMYWFLPMKKYLQSLVKNNPLIQQDIQKLYAAGLRFNLDLLEKGTTPEGRREIARAAGLAEAAVTGLVNRADFSRMPWASAATVSNIIGAGYGSLSKLANADPEKLHTDFFLYGAAIGKDLRFGNEIDSSYRIAQFVPKVVVD
jgi:hypothetical protein